ncbi:hypothetical protein [unidentified bacterial endosymbiont]|uniref:hypothetical protein n=1 Tax=unidentified bacterial endosymbiont TaxID=2355 RepID=UPI0020A0F6BA|nr:hypothetical protein [unidentified bacterial endosymbiont]
MEHFLAQSVIHSQPIMQIATYRMNSSSLFSMTLKSEHSTAQACLSDLSGTLDKIVPGSSLFLTAGESSLQQPPDSQSVIQWVAERSTTFNTCCAHIA